jgi:hypothetical protein
VTVCVYFPRVETSLNMVLRFRGAVIGRQLAHPNRAFALEVTLDLVKGRDIFVRKPPTHFHFQEEYIQALEGRLGLEIEGKELVLSAKDGPYTIRPFVNHRSYPLPESQQEGCQIVKFLLSGKKTSDPYELNPVFFENWYKYQDEIVVKGAQMSLIQVLSVRDQFFGQSNCPEINSHILDIYCWRVISFISTLGPFWSDFVSDLGSRAGKVDRRAAWLSAFLSKMDHRLGASMSENGIIYLLEEIRRQE